MSKFFKKHYQSFLLTVLLLLFTAAAGYWMEHYQTLSYPAQGLLALACLADGFLVWKLYRRLKKKWKDALAERAKKLFARASMLLMKLMEKFDGVFRLFRRRSTLLGGKTTVSFDFSAPEKKKKPPKAPKWKQMETARQKLGYLYYHLITRRLKEGMPAGSSDTPLELQHRRENLPPEEQLFDLYVSARYDERAELSEAELDELKKTLFAGKK
ncbi:MAG: hypothetical protein IJX82_03085 [Clostridia bacterium]|nr:hypothetical protein [Clostridia bacterium]